MAQPSYPKWYIQFFPAPLALALREEDLRAMVLIWGMFCEAIRKGEEPVFRMQDVVRQIAALTGTSERTAYRWVARLLDITLDGKRLLRAALARENRVPAPAGGSEAALAPEGVPALDRLPSRGLVIRPGEALEPWVRLARRVLDKNDIVKNDNPNMKQGTPGGGGYIHGLPDLEKPPPPPNQYSDRTDIVDKNNNVVRSDIIDISGERISPALRAVARAIGVTTRAGLAALAASGLGPRSLLRYWDRVREGGGGVGALVASLADGEAVRGLIPPPDPAALPAFDPCPGCGADLAASGWRRSRDRCPSCGTALRTCPACGELAPREGPCPWCGAEPPLEDEAGASPDLEPDPEARVRSAWTTSLKALQEHFPDILQAACLEEAFREEDGWRLRVSASDDRMAAAIREAVAPLMARILGVRVRIECHVREEE